MSRGSVVYYIVAALQRSGLLTEGALEGLWDAAALGWRPLATELVRLAWTLVLGRRSEPEVAPVKRAEFTWPQ